MDEDNYFARIVAKCSSVDLPIENLPIVRVLVEGNGKRRWVRMENADGSLYSIEIMDGVVEVFPQGNPVIRSRALDDFEWSTEYYGANFRLTKVQIWLDPGSSDDVLVEFAAGPKCPEGTHRRRLCAREFCGAEWVQLWLFAA